MAFDLFEDDNEDGFHQLLGMELDDLSTLFDPHPSEIKASQSSGPTSEFVIRPPLYGVSQLLEETSTEELPVNALTLDHLVKLNSLPWTEIQALLTAVQSSQSELVVPSTPSKLDTLLASPCVITPLFGSIFDDEEGIFFLIFNFYFFLKIIKFFYINFFLYLF